MTYKDIAAEALEMLELLADHGCLLSEEENKLDELIEDFNTLIKRGK